MQDIFGFLLLTCIILLVLGLIKPDISLFWYKGQKVRKNVLLFYGIGLVASFIGFGVFSPTESDDIDKISDAKNIEPSKQANKESVLFDENGNENNEIQPYEILKETTKRFDDAKSYFVLIEPIDKTNNKFKKEIKKFINQIVSKKGSKISIDFLDNKDALELMYKSHYGANTLGRVLNKNELKVLANHSVASFSGELETGIYLNSLYFFPSAFKETPVVGKYVETIEYNPGKTNKVTSDKNEKIPYKTLREWNPNKNSNAIGLDILIDKKYASKDQIKELLNEIVGNNELANILIFTSKKAWIEVNESSKPTNESLENYIAFYVKNETGEGAYRGFNEIRWMQENGNLSNLYGTNTKL